MQRLLTTVCCALLFMSTALGQLSILVTGTVTTEDGDAVADVDIFVSALFADSTFYLNSVSTNSFGVYSDVILASANASEALITVSLFDCNGTVQEAVFNWVPGLPDIVQDFVYCGGIGSDSCSVVIIPEFDPASGETSLFALPLNDNAVTFSWNTGATTQSIVPNAFGTYCVEITTANGCTATDCFEFVGDSTACFVMIESGGTGSTPGDILIATGYGIPPFSYIWNTGETGATIAVTGPGEYCVTMTDATGCEASECLVVDTIDCHVYILSTPNGGLEAVGFGAEPITYEWSTGEAGPIIFPGQPGTYCVTMADANGCTATACYTYDFNDCEVFVACDPPGHLTAFAFGVEPISYLWSTGETTQSITPDHEGEYCVTITDANGCTATGCGYFFPFDFCETILFYVSDSTAGTVGNTLFAFSLGIPPFSYQWSTGDTTEYIALDSLVPGICVTVTDATGCVDTACTDELLNMCWSWISLEYTGAGATLTAVSDIFGNTTPSSYLWSTGETTQSISVTVEGEYCVTVTNANGCTSEACVYVDFGVFGDTCLALVLAFPDPAADLYTVEALAFGTPPFTYAWSTGETTASIQVADLSNDLCVTVTDGTGCVAEACYIDINYPFCDVWIDAHPTDSAGIWSLTALGNALSPNWQYQWSTGETTPSILVSASGDYCVTVTGGVSGTVDSCYAEACIFVDVEFGNPTDFAGPVEGFIHGNGFQEFSGSVGLYSMNANDANNALWSLIDSTPIVDGNFYSFSEVPAGIYAVKVTLDASSDASAQFFPTYHLSAVAWEHADPVFVPSGLAVSTDIHLVAQSMVTGVGIIAGSLVDPDNLLPAPANRSEGIAGVYILLHDAHGQPVRFTRTDANGAYRFDGLDWGTYRLTFDAVGIRSPQVWVTIGPEQPAATGVRLSSSELTTGTREILTGAELKLMPQPATDRLTVTFSDRQVTGVHLQIMSISGQTLQVYHDTLTNGGNATLDISGLTPGMYLLRVLTDQGQITRKWIKQ